MKSRRDRRRGMPLENRLVFYGRHVAREIRNGASMLWTYWRLRRSLGRIWTDPQRFAYRDQAITPPDADELKLSLYQETRGTAQAIEKRQQDLMRSTRAAESRREKTKASSEARTSDVRTDGGVLTG